MKLISVRKTKPTKINAKNINKSTVHHETQSGNLGIFKKRKTEQAGTRTEIFKRVCYCARSQIQTNQHQKPRINDIHKQHKIQ